jgi:quinol monooxygenase YgiN
MRENEGVRLVIEIEVDDIDLFKETAQRCVEVSRTEPGTLVYDWYIDEANGKARLYEAYESVEALRAHAAGPVFTDVGLPMMQCSTFVHVDAFGDFGEMAEQDAFWPTTYWGPAFVALTE